MENNNSVYSKYTCEPGLNWFMSKEKSTREKSARLLGL